MTQPRLITDNQLHCIKGLDPIADAFSGTVYSDVINATAVGWIVFLLHWGVGATGTTTLTVIPCDDVVPTNRGTAVAFWSRVCATGDTWAAPVARAAAGFTTTAGSSQMYAVEVDPAVLAASGYKYVQLKCVESVDSPILGGILIFTLPKYAEDVVATQIT